MSAIDVPRGAALIAWIANHPPSDRDAACERLLGIGETPRVTSTDAAPERELVGYYPSGVAPIVRAVVNVPIGADDVFVDLGSGLGKAAILVHLLCDARVLGIERVPEFVALAERSVARLALSHVTFSCVDARVASVDEGTVFYLYLPFTGAVLAEVMSRLHVVATRRAIVVVTLGLDLDEFAWLTPRPSDSFWLATYDSVSPGVAARDAMSEARATTDVTACAIDAITNETVFDSALDV